MASRSIAENEVWLNSQKYRIKGPVRKFVASVQPGKVTIGDYGDQSNPLASTIDLGDFRGGIGIHKADLSKDQGRCWWSTCQLRYRRQVVLPRRPVLTAAGPAQNVQVFVEFLNEMYAGWGTEVYKYNNTTDSWGSNLRTLLAVATDAIAGFVGATNTLVLATTTEVEYSTDGSSWSRNTTNIKYLAIWKDLLWGIDNDGQLYYTDDLSGAWTTDAYMFLPAGYVTDLFVGPDAQGNDILYCSTKVGLYAHDDANRRFVKTKLELPFHPDGGIGTTVFRGAIYFPAGLGIYKYLPGSPASITIMGPDRDDGLPSDKRGKIKRLINSHNGLIAATDATTGASATTRFHTTGAGTHHGAFAKRDTGFSHLLEWDEQGWQSLWLGGSTALAITDAVVGNAYDTYRLWWASNQRVYYMTIPRDIINPSFVSTQQYDTSGSLETSWMDFGDDSANKLALEIQLETTNPTSSETVAVEYAINYVESYTAVTTATTTGLARVAFPSSGDPVGVAFRSIKFRITLSRGSTNTNTPALVKLILAYRRKNRLLEGWQFTIDKSKSYNGQSPAQQASNLLTALTSTTLVEWTYRNNSLSGNPENYFVEILNRSEIEEAGNDPRGDVNIVVAEPRRSVSP